MAVTSISLATTSVRKDREGQTQERTEWHRVKFFGKLAEIAGEYLKKGRQVYVEGSIRTERYEDQQGVEKFATEIIANEMQMLGNVGGERDRGEPSTPRTNSGSQRSGARETNRSSSQSSRREPVTEAVEDDDIPF
jgi:single-strand DNA-binding protein